MARALLAAGADFKTANRLGVTPLLMACRLGSSSIVELLLDAGADPKAVYPGGETLLMAAAGAGDVEPMKLLFARGVDVNAKESGQQQTALMFAAIEGHSQVVQALVKAGADPNLSAKVATLSRASMGDTGRDWVTHPTGGLTALMFAVREGHIDVANTLIDTGADLNTTTPDGLTALLMAVINDQIDLSRSTIAAQSRPMATPRGPASGIQTL